MLHGLDGTDSSKSNVLLGQIGLTGTLEALQVGVAAEIGVDPDVTANVGAVADVDIMGGLEIPEAKAGVDMEVGDEK